MRLKNTVTVESCKTRKEIGGTQYKFMDGYMDSTSSQRKEMVKQITGNERTLCMDNLASGQ